MKKTFLWILGFLMKWIGLIGGVISAVFLFSEFDTNTDPNSIRILVIATVALFISWIIGKIMLGNARKLCLKCGIKGNPIDATYVGSNTTYTDHDNGYTKTTTHKYLITYVCPNCKRQWHVKTSRSTDHRVHL